MSCSVELDNVLDPSGTSLRRLSIVRIMVLFTMATYILLYVTYYLAGAGQAIDFDHWMSRFEQMVCAGLLLFWLSYVPLFAAS